VPELGGWYDARNPSHKMLMSVLGGMSESERQHVQARVRAAIDAQVVNEGRHQGGRAPYGYTVVDGGPDPNPSGPPWVSGCGCWYWTRGRRRWWRGFSPSTWTGPGIERSRPGSTGTVSRARRRADRSRTGTGGATAGRAARSGRSWRIRATPATRCSAAGPIGWCVRGCRHIRRSCPWPSSLKPSCVARRGQPAGSRRWSGSDPRPVVPAARAGPLRAVPAQDAGRVERQARALSVHRPPVGAGIGRPDRSPEDDQSRREGLIRAINRWIGQLFDRKHIDETVRALVDSLPGAASVGDREAGKRRLADAEQA
jgi:hypothetical protein